MHVQPFFPLSICSGINLFFPLFPPLVAVWNVTPLLYPPAAPVILSATPLASFPLKIVAFLLFHLCISGSNLEFELEFAANACLSFQLNNGQRRLLDETHCRGALLPPNGLECETE